MACSRFYWTFSCLCLLLFTTTLVRSAEDEDYSDMSTIERIREEDAEEGRYRGESLQCKDPTKLPHMTTVIVSGDPFQMNTVIKVKCDAGYHLPGGQSSVNATCVPFPHPCMCMAGWETLTDFSILHLDCTGSSRGEASQREAQAEASPNVAPQLTQPEPEQDDPQCPDPTPVNGTVRVLSGTPYSDGCNVLLTCDRGKTFPDGMSVWNLNCVPAHQNLMFWLPVHDDMDFVCSDAQVEAEGYETAEDDQQDSASQTSENKEEPQYDVVIEGEKEKREAVMELTEAEEKDDPQCRDPTPVNGTVRVLSGTPYSYDCNVLLTCDRGKTFPDGMSVWNLTCLPAVHENMFWVPIHYEDFVCSEGEKEKREAVTELTETEEKGMTQREEHASKKEEPLEEVETLTGIYEDVSKESRVEEIEGIPEQIEERFTKFEEKEDATVEKEIGIPKDEEKMTGSAMRLNTEVTHEDTIQEDTEEEFEEPEGETEESVEEPEAFNEESTVDNVDEHTEEEEDTPETVEDYVKPVPLQRPLYAGEENEPILDEEEHEEADIEEHEDSETESESAETQEDVPEVEEEVPEMENEVPEVEEEVPEVEEEVPEIEVQYPEIEEEVPELENEVHEIEEEVPEIEEEVPEIEKEIHEIEEEVPEIEDEVPEIEEEVPEVEEEQQEHREEALDDETKMVEGQLPEIEQDESEINQEEEEYGQSTDEQEDEHNGQMFDDDEMESEEEEEEEEELTFESLRDILKVPPYQDERHVKEPWHAPEELENSDERLEGMHPYCSLPPMTGPCRALKARFYFDTDTGECHRFIFGGCRGNGNNFRSMEECLDLCSGGH